MKVACERAGGDQAHVQQHQPVEIVGRRFQVVVDDDHRLAPRAQLAQQVDDRALGGRIDAGERLVHEVELGVLRQRPRQEHALLLPAGELADLPVGVVGHADPAPGSAAPARAAALPGRRTQPRRP